MPIYGLFMFQSVTSRNYPDLASVPGLPRYAIYCARLIVREREILKTVKAGRPGMKHHVPIDVGYGYGSRAFHYHNNVDIYSRRAQS